MVSNDVNKFDSFIYNLQFVWIGPLQTILVTYLLWPEIGAFSLLGVATFFFFIPLQGKKKENIINVKLFHNLIE